MVRQQILKEIVGHYIANRRQRVRRELSHYARQISLREAITEAALSRVPDENNSLRLKRHSHQYRIPGKILVRAKTKLQERAMQIARVASFESLHDLVEKTILPIHGIGPLTVYDIALRIGTFLKLEPKLIYLHAGAREGAKAIKLSGKTIQRRQLPKELRRLSPAEIEHCLCIYRKNFRGKGRRPRAFSKTDHGCEPCQIFAAAHC